MGILLTAEGIAQLIADATGREFGVAELRKSGERVYNLMRAFCVREGVDRAQDVLPPRLTDDPLPGGPAEGMVIEADMLEKMKDAYYQFRGWDTATGIPTPDTLRGLGLEELVSDLW